MTDSDLIIELKEIKILHFYDILYFCVSISNKKTSTILKTSHSFKLRVLNQALKNIIYPS
jgi:hypothetical protein